MSELLRLIRVCKTYGDTRVLDNLDFAVNEGELRCLLGPNGAGKTTCMDMITGRQKVSSGHIYFDNVDITKYSENRIARRGIGRKFQIPAVLKGLTVAENLAIADSHIVGPFANMMRFRKNPSVVRFNDTVELIGLGDQLKTQAGLLSHGETQWLEIGMVLMQDPRLLLLDEPTAGMTEQETHKTSQIVNELKGKHTLVVVEHDMSFVREIADVVTVMHMGQHLAEGTIAEIERNQEVKDIYLGSGQSANA